MKHDLQNSLIALLMTASLVFVVLKATHMVPVEIVGSDSPEAYLPSLGEWKANPVEAKQDQEWVQKHYESLK